MDGIKDERTRAHARSTVALCFCAALVEGFDIQSMGVAAPKMAPALRLGHNELGLAFSASSVGLLLGALLFGRMADRVGRKQTLILSLAIFGAFSLATAIVGNLPSLLVVRILAGIGLGGAMPNLIALSAESTHKRGRARIVTLMASGFPFGAGLAGVVAAFSGWKEVFLVGGAAPLALAPLIAVLVPESQSFIRALEVRRSTRPSNLGVVGILFGAGRAVSTTLLWLASFAALLSLYLLINWLPTLLIGKGIAAGVARLIMLLFNAGGGFGVLAFSALLGRPQRTWTFAAACAGQIVSLTVLAFSNGDLRFAGAASFFAGAFVASAPVALYGLASEYYEVAVRGTGVGATVAVGRFSGILGPLVAAFLLGIGANETGVLLALVPLSLVAGLATIALVQRPTASE